MKQNGDKNSRGVLIINGDRINGHWKRTDWLEVPIPYIRPLINGLNFREDPHNFYGQTYATYMVLTYLHFRYFRILFYSHWSGMGPIIGTHCYHPTGHGSHGSHGIATRDGANRGGFWAPKFWETSTGMALKPDLGMTEKEFSSSWGLVNWWKLRNSTHGAQNKPVHLSLLKCSQPKVLATWGNI